MKKKKEKEKAFPSEVLPDLDFWSKHIVNSHHKTLIPDLNCDIISFCRSSSLDCSQILCILREQVCMAMYLNLEYAYTYMIHIIRIHSLHDRKSLIIGFTLVISQLIQGKFQRKTSDWFFLIIIFFFLFFYIWEN